MMYDKHSFSYQMNLEALYTMEKSVPMTLEERRCIREWVRKGHEIESNPWNCIDSDGMPLNFLQAYRLEVGYSSGPWDYWKGSEHQTNWDDSLKCFLLNDDFY